MSEKENQAILNASEPHVRSLEELDSTLDGMTQRSQVKLQVARTPSRVTWEDMATPDVSPEDLEYFRSLPEYVLEAQYPNGIWPPANLGPSTPYDRFDQFQQAIVHLAAGVPMEDVIRVGRFDISGRNFVKHMAAFCAQTLDYTKDDVGEIRTELLGSHCSHVEDGGFCEECSKLEFIKMKIPDGSVDNETGYGPYSEGFGENLSLRLLGQQLATWVVLLLVIWWSYESKVRPLLTWRLW